MMDNRQLPQTDGALGDLRSAQRGSASLIACGLMLVVMLVAAFVFGPEVYRRQSRKRGLGFVMLARQAIAAGKWDEAGPHIKAALGFAPQDLAVLRITAEFCEHAGAIEAVNYRGLAAAAPGATHEDRLQLARTAIDFEAYNTAGEQLARLLADDPQDLEALKTRSALFFLQGDFEGAIRTAEAASTLDLHDRMPEYSLGTLLFESADPARQARGAALLWGLAFSTGAPQRLALRRLASHQSWSAAERQLLLRQVATMAAAPAMADRLVSLALRCGPGEPGYGAASTEALALGHGRPLPERAQIAAWLNERGAYEDMLALLPLGEVAHDVDCLTWHLNALIALGHWHELDDLFEQPNLTLSEFSRHVGRALLNLVAHDPRQAQAQLRAALAAAPDSVPAALFVADFAVRHGQAAAAIEAWESLMHRPEFIRRGWSETLRLARSTDTPEPLIAAARRLLEIDPENLNALTELAYALLLSGRTDDDIFKQLDRAAASPATERELLATQALSLLKAEKVDEAMLILETRVNPQANDSLRVRVVRCAALGAAHQARPAAAAARQLDPERLWLSERELIAAWLPDRDRR